jgi:hypothetical protein
MVGKYMENELLIKKRYVKGLKLASIALFGLYFMGLTNIIFVPGLETVIVRQLATFMMVSGVITFGAIATLIEEKTITCVCFLPF